MATRGIYDPKIYDPRIYDANGHVIDTAFTEAPDVVYGRIIVTSFGQFGGEDRRPKKKKAPKIIKTTTLRGRIIEDPDIVMGDLVQVPSRKIDAQFIEDPDVVQVSMVQDPTDDEMVMEFIARMCEEEEEVFV